MRCICRRVSNLEKSPRFYENPYTLVLSYAKDSWHNLYRDFDPLSASYQRLEGVHCNTNILVMFAPAWVFGISIFFRAQIHIVLTNDQLSVRQIFPCRTDVFIDPLTRSDPSSIVSKTEIYNREVVLV